MSEVDYTPDVLVIGGGPAGSTVATMIARQGARVVLLEREHFPREHVGESLLPASIPVLEELGVLPEVQEAGFLPKWGATMVWGKDRTPWSWYFKETNQQYPHSYQVWRPQFDQLLLDNSRKAGVDVREGYRVVQALFQEGKAYGVRYQTGSGGIRQLDAGFVVDASGQGGVLAQQLRSRRWDPFFHNLAVYGYFEGAGKLSEPNETNIFIESFSHGWLWTIPLHTGMTSVGAVVDSVTGQDAIRLLGAQGFLEGQISQAPETAALLRGAHLSRGPHVVKDWSYVCDDLVGDGYVLVGDAACFVDPLFSSGVHLALMSGVLAAAYVTSARKDPELGRAAAKVYQELYLKEYNQFREMARLFYSSNLSADSYFWEARRLVEGAGNFSPSQAFIRAVAGQPPRGYERAVLDRGQVSAEFIKSVGIVESDRAARRDRVARALESENSSLTGPGGSGFRQAVPRLADGVGVQRKPVVGQGEFEWGYVVSTPGHPEGTACSGLVASLVHLIDGKASVADLYARLAAGLDGPRAAQVESNI